MVELGKAGKYKGLTSPDDDQTQKSNEFIPSNLASSIHYPKRVPMDLLSGLVSLAASHFPWKALYVFLSTLLRSLLHIHFHSFIKLLSTGGFLLELWLCLWLYQWKSCSSWTKRSEECGRPGQRGHREHPGALYWNSFILEGLWTCDSGDSLRVSETVMLTHSWLASMSVHLLLLFGLACFFFLPSLVKLPLCFFAHESHCKYF